MTLILPRDAVRCPVCDLVQYVARAKCRYCGATMVPLTAPKPEQRIAA